MTHKAFALLTELLRRPGRLITKTELFETVWAGRVVTDAALSRVIRELRVALGDDAGTPRYIATAHGLGFRFVAVVAMDGSSPAAALASDAPDAPANPLPDGRLVRRDAELAVLDQALADARLGKRRVVFVTGEAGIGKTALVEAFLERHAVGADLCWAQGRCIEQYGTGEAYLPILEALEGIARQTGAGALRGVLARYAPAWLALLPWLAHDTDPALPQRNPAITPDRMLREIAQALEVLATEQTIVLWLEDLHWSDPSTLAVVSFLAGRREPARLLLAATFRPGDAHAAETPLPGLVSQLRQRKQALELALQRLDADAVEAYLAQRFDSVGSGTLRELAAFVHQRTEGNALFTVAVVDDLLRRGLLEPSGDGCRLTAPLAELGDVLPDSLRHLVHDEIDRLSDADRRLVEAAAVAGVDFSAAAVAAALQTDVATVEDRCTRLAEQGRLLRGRSATTWPDGTVASGFGFLHALYWRGTDERVPEGRRADWQQRIGVAQERAYASQLGSIAAELAMRFEAGRDADRSVRYCRLAAAGALARGAYQEGIDHLRRALAALPRLPPAQQPREELDVLLPLGAALMTVQGYASAEVEATYQRALTLCHACGGPGDLDRIERGLWNVWFSRADLARARTTAEALLARASAQADEGLVFDALAKLGHTGLHSGDFTEARAHLERALAMSEATVGAAFRRESPRLLAYLSWVLWYLGEPGRALDCSARSLASVGPDTSVHTSVHTQVLLLGHASWLRWMRGEVREAADFGARQVALSVEHGLTYWRVWGEFMVGLGAAHEGRVAEGTAAMRAATQTMQRLGTVVGTTSWLYLLAEVELSAGRVDAARAALAGSSDLIACGSRARNAAETARVEGELALAEDGAAASRARAEQAFATALKIARDQGASSLELRAAMRLARLWNADGNAARGHDLLAPIRACFSEGVDTADLRQADALLARWQAPGARPG